MQMAEYIDKQEVLYILNSLNTAHLELTGKPMFGFISATDLIQDIPAADVRPVVRGEWKPTGAGCLTSKCSVCGNKSIETGNFCHNCGADIRVGDAE